MPVHVLAVGMNERMRRLVSRATDILGLPTDQDFALRSMSITLRSMGLAPKMGRPLGYSQRRATAARKAKATRTRTARKR